MRYFKYRFESKTLFSNPVSVHSYLLRTTPLDRKNQKLMEWSIELIPEYSVCQKDQDCWGNTINYGIVNEPHKSFGFLSSGKVEVSGTPVFDSAPLPVFSVPTILTSYTPEMDCMSRNGNNLVLAMEIVEMMKGRLQYVTGSTDVMTTAGESFSQGKGVCQDFAHILIAICRKHGIPARYICGFVLGEGVTHAWTEIWSQGAWHAIDPTAGKICDDSYIAIAMGRDAQDCSVSRGIFFGTTRQETYTKVTVDEI